MVNFLKSEEQTPYPLERFMGLEKCNREKELWGGG